MSLVFHYLPFRIRRPIWPLYGRTERPRPVISLAILGTAITTAQVKGTRVPTPQTGSTPGTVAIHDLAQVPEVLRAARINLKDPPRIYTEVAISQFEGVLRLYREDVPAAGAECRDARIQADLAEADSGAVRATEEFLAFLRDDLLPRSTGSLALGREVYQRKLACEEMELTPVDSLLARGWRALEETQRRMEAVAERIAPGGGVPAALESLETHRPSADQLVFRRIAPAKLYAVSNVAAQFSPGAPAPAFPRVAGWCCTS